MSEKANKIAHKLLELRKLKGVTQAEVCKATGIGRRTLVFYEKGRTPNPGILTLNKLASYYGVSLSEIIS